MRSLFLLNFFVAICWAENSRLGTAIDIDHPVTYDNLMNIRLNKISTIYIRSSDTYNYGTFDKTMSETIKNANICRFNVELYMNLNPGFSFSGGQQIENLWNGLRNNFVRVYAIWIRLTDLIDWPNDTVKNVNNILSAIKTAKQLGFRKIGIFTNSNDWNKITGNWSQLDNDVLLWYHKNGSLDDFSDFEPFGNWPKPSVKQYQVNNMLEGTLVNRDVYDF